MSAPVLTGIRPSLWARSVDAGAVYERAVVERFVANFRVDSEGCWIWQLAPSGPGASEGKGYGLFSAAGHPREQAHRVSYRMFRGAIPHGLQIDHVCRVRMCVNPDHLDVVTHAENLRRGVESRTTCRRGHEYTPENTRYSTTGYRECRTCLRAKEARRARRRST